jgi:hypothetical protein
VIDYHGGRARRANAPREIAPRLSEVESVLRELTRRG